MNAADAADLLIHIAQRDLGKVETSRNRAPWILKYWPDTSYPDGYANREPYCAAACCHWLAQLGRDLAATGELRKTLGMGSAQFNRFRCKSARAFDWRDWGRKQGLHVLPGEERGKPGDFVVFDFSHIGLVVKDKGNHIETIEANTNSAGSRDGDGVWQKLRSRSLVQCFVRVLDWEKTSH